MRSSQLKVFFLGCSIALLLICAIFFLSTSRQTRSERAKPQLYSSESKPIKIDKSYQEFLNKNTDIQILNSIEEDIDLDGIADKIVLYDFIDSSKHDDSNVNVLLLFSNRLSSALNLTNGRPELIYRKGDPFFYSEGEDKLTIDVFNNGSAATGQLFLKFNRNISPPDIEITADSFNIAPKE